MQVSADVAARSYGAARNLTSPEEGSGQSFGATAAGMAQDFNAVLQRAEQTSQAAMTGGADPHALVSALSEAQLAVETAVAVRDKVVEAYLEVLRMPV